MTSALLPPGRENRPHIGLYGRCNAGKSSLLNFITGSRSAIVSPLRGTTTDPVRKSYEIQGFAPVVWIDTAGTDDTSALGRARMKATLGTIPQIDLALLVLQQWGDPERRLAERFRSAGVPFIPVGNIVGGREFPEKMRALIRRETGREVVCVCAAGNDSAQRALLLGEVRKAVPDKAFRPPSLFGGRVAEGDLVLLVCPIDSGAPAGRLILPQVQAVRDLLDHRAVAVALQPGQIGAFFALGLRPRLIVTDSQLFREVAAAVPEGIEITSFSILLAAAKGDYEAYEAGLESVDALQDGDRVLIVENCLHQTSCEDIGRVKIPAWLGEYTGKKLRFEFLSGPASWPDGLSRCALVVQCGGCTATRSQLQNRIRAAQAAGIPVTNYGMLIRKLRLG